MAGDMYVSGGFSNKDPRDLFISIGNEIIEAPMGMPCRPYEYASYENIFNRTNNNEKYVYTVAPKPMQLLRGLAWIHEHHALFFFFFFLPVALSATMQDHVAHRVLPATCVELTTPTAQASCHGPVASAASEKRG